MRILHTVLIVCAMTLRVPNKMTSHSTPNRRVRPAHRNIKRCVGRTLHPFLILLGALSGFAPTFAAEPGKMPMPPVFDARTDTERALTEYPLAVITREAAFAHHGKAHREVSLPNGLTGWVYQVGEGAGLRTYTLVFDAQQKVIDVLYNERGRHNGLTALALQAQAKGVLGPDVEPQPPKRHAPDEFKPGK